MKDVIIRNLERLLQLDADGEREAIEPMTEWKWNKLYKIVSKYHLGPWVAEGIENYSNDFFLQMSPTLHQQFMALKGQKNEEDLEKFLLYLDRQQGFIHHFSSRSIKGYYNELLNNIKNIEE